MRYRFNYLISKLFQSLILILFVIGVFKGTEFIISVISAVLSNIMPCVIIIGGLYILIKALFR